LKRADVCRGEGFELWCGDEPLGEPMDRFLAEGIVSRATHEEALRELGKRRRRGPPLK